MGLKELRLKYNLSQKKLAECLDWKRSRVAAVEQLKTEIKEEWAEHMAKFFEMTLEDFMYEYRNGWKEKN